jgi:hypothetical protein
MPLRTFSKPLLSWWLLHMLDYAWPCLTLFDFLCV